MLQDKKIAVVGLGYVGLPLAVELAKQYNVIGFDIKPERITELRNGKDNTLEVSSQELLDVADKLRYTSEKEAIEEASIYIVTVPTPIDLHKKPDLTPLIKASETVGSVLGKGDIVIYESTVYPGCTEDECVPVLEKFSGLKFNEDFYCGYSPERINPGDKERRIHNIKKVTSGSTPEIAEEIDVLYRSIVTVGTHKASCIKVAEAAKVIENAQRDLNIAFVNELALIFERVGIDTTEVLEAAGTKWNFLPFRPGLVGGHCIGVDPYYLTYKAESLGYNPQVILSGRRINDNMGMYIANRIVKLMSKKGNPVNGANALVLGITFKENCPDIRNSKVIDIITELQSFGINVDTYDPHASPEEVQEEYGVNLVEKLDKKYNSIILAVAHNDFVEFDFAKYSIENTVLFDVKSFLKLEKVDGRL